MSRQVFSWDKIDFPSFQGILYRVAKTIRTTSNNHLAASYMALIAADKHDFLKNKWDVRGQMLTREEVTQLLDTQITIIEGRCAGEVLTINRVISSERKIFEQELNKLAVSYDDTDDEKEDSESETESLSI